MGRANADLGRWVEELENRSREISLLNELGDQEETLAGTPQGAK